jgi:hypothetical protein
VINKTEKIIEIQPKIDTGIFDSSKGQRKRKRNRALKITNTNGQTADQLQTLEELKNEGIVLKNRNKGNKYSCLVCNPWFKQINEALCHKQSEDHSMTKLGERFKGIDRLLAIDSEKLNDIEVVLSRKAELGKIGISVKEGYLNHGIRLKDGNGSQAYVCLECNLSFTSLKLAFIWKTLINVKMN